MSTEDQGNQKAELPSELIANIRKEILGQISKWVVGGAILLAGFALSGWWFYLKPKIEAYIYDAGGGVPPNSILLSTAECKNLGNKWRPFTEGTGRFVVGAGTEMNPGYAYWTPAAGGQPIKLSEYKVMSPGGEEKHLLSMDEMPKHTHKLYRTQGKGGDGKYPDWASMGSEKPQIVAETLESGGSAPHSILPPFVALYYCQKASS